MRLMILTSAMLVAGAAHAQTRTNQATPTGQPEETNVVVDAPDQQVCRSVRRTGTRMRATRVCRTVTQWAAASGPRSSDDQISDAADTLDAMGADDLSTNCIGDPLGDSDGDGIANAREHDTPLGPRQE